MFKPFARGDSEREVYGSPKWNELSARTVLTCYIHGALNNASQASSHSVRHLIFTFKMGRATIRVPLSETRSKAGRTHSAEGPACTKAQRYNLGGR